MIDKKFKTLIRDTGIFAIGSLGSKLILFFLLPLYTHYMTDAQYGIADLIQTVGQLLLPFASLVIYDSIVRFGLSKAERPQDVLLNALIVCGLGSAFTLCATPLLSLYEAIAEWKWLLAAYVIFNMLNSVIMNYLKVKDLNKLYAVLSIIQTATLALANIVFLCVLDCGVTGYILSIVLSIGLNAMAAFVVGRLFGDLRTASFKKPLMKEMVLFSAPLILNNISWWVIQSSDKVMLEAMLGAAALGVFTVASKIPSLINVMISIFSQAWGLSSVREYEDSNDPGFYSSVLNAYQVVAFGASILLIAFTKPFMDVYVGEGFSAAWQYVPFLLISASFSAISSYYGSLYSALKKSVNNMVTTVIAALLNIVINLVGIHFIGIWGAVAGTVVSYIAIALLRLIDVGRFINIQINVKSFVANASVAVIEALAVSFDFWPIPVSAFCIAVYAVVNREYVGKVIRLRK